MSGRSHDCQVAALITSELQLPVAADTRKRGGAVYDLRSRHLGLRATDPNLVGGTPILRDGEDASHRRERGRLRGQVKPDGRLLREVAADRFGI